MSESQKIKGAKTIVLLGFLSFLGCGLYAVPGTIISIWGFYKFKQVKAVYLTNPEIYKDSWVDARAGLILCILGFILSIVTFVWTLSLFGYI